MCESQVIEESTYAGPLVVQLMLLAGILEPVAGVESLSDSFM